MWTKIQTTELSQDLCGSAPTCLSYFLPHHSLCFSYTGFLLFFKHAKLFPTPGPLRLLFPSLGTCFFIFSMTDFLTHHVASSSKQPCLTILVRHHLWSLTPLFFFFPHLVLFSFTRFITSCNYPVISLLVYCLSPLLPPQPKDSAQGRDFACFMHHYIFST